MNPLAASTNPQFKPSKMNHRFTLLVQVRMPAEQAMGTSSALEGGGDGWWAACKQFCKSGPILWAVLLNVDETGSWPKHNAHVEVAVCPKRSVDLFQSPSLLGPCFARVGVPSRPSPSGFLLPGGHSVIGSFIR